MRKIIRNLKKIVPAKIFLSIKYGRVFNERINWRNPVRFNEKLQWLKLYDKKKIYTVIVDKYKCKEYVSNIIGEKYIIPAYGCWDTFSKIDFSKLPEQFVLKCTHDSGGVVIVKNKDAFDYKENKVFFDNKLKENYYYDSREWPYKHVKPRIIAEKLLHSNNESGIQDYKLQCFDGKFDNILVCVGRNSINGVRYYYFDRDWNYLPYSDYDYVDKSEFGSLKPNRFDEMIEIAEKLSKGFTELRVDLYESENQLYFGELTLFTSSGFDLTITKEADLILGTKLKLPNTISRDE